MSVQEKCSEASLVMQITLRCTMSKTNSGRVIAIDLKNDADNSKYINDNIDRIIFLFCSHIVGLRRWNVVLTLGIRGVY